jgi:hypothetical protein
MLDVIGAGFGRTGTHSLGLALEKLGFGPCYNMHEVAKNMGHRELWNSALDGEHVDWHSLFSSYNSAVEWPSVAFFEEIIQHFRDAKVILTLRDPESWYESAKNTIFEALELSAHNPDPSKRESQSLTRRLILEYTFEGRYWEKEHIIEVYRKHIQRVGEVVPKERLLQFDVKDGWKPLCDYLQKAIPTEPFPKVNERSDFIDSAPEWAKKIRESRRQKGT